MLSSPNFLRDIRPPMDSRPKISERHRKELLRFLLQKTAPVRIGIKPGELLRVRHCYSQENKEGFRYCLYRNDVYEILGLEFIELLCERDSSLVLFYDRETLSNTLARPESATFLKSCGYILPSDADALLLQLQRRFAASGGLCHEVGVFIGYPVKDVFGFMNSLKSTPGHNTPWRIFGDAAESLRLASAYRHAEEIAHSALDATASIQSFIQLCAGLRLAKT